jgi:hypothetical protein
VCDEASMIIVCHEDHLAPMDIGCGEPIDVHVFGREPLGEQARTCIGQVIRSDDKDACGPIHTLI